MTENLSSSILGNSNWKVGDATRQGKAAFRQGVDAARRGVDAARQGLGQAQEYVGDGLDLLNDTANSLSDFVSRQPLVAVAGAFLIGYMAARLLRKASS